MNTPEPEEIVEAHIVARLAAGNVGIPVEGSITPAAEGEVKTGDDTFVNVSVDQGEPLLHSKTPSGVHSYSVVVTAHVAFCDDKDGALFRDVCRAIRAVLTACEGDGCAVLDGDGLSVRDFCIDSTKTDLEANAGGDGMRKSYNATLWGRV